jgi:hypothetical protein
LETGRDIKNGRGAWQHKFFVKSVAVNLSVYQVATYLCHGRACRSADALR